MKPRLIFTWRKFNLKKVVLRFFKKKREIKSFLFGKFSVYTVLRESEGNIRFKCIFMHLICKSFNWKNYHYYRDLYILVYALQIILEQNCKFHRYQLKSKKIHSSSRLKSLFPPLWSILFSNIKVYDSLSCSYIINTNF